MNLGNLRVLARAMIPSAKIGVIDNSVLDLILNSGAKDIAAYTLCLKSNKKFNAVASQAEYNLSSVIGDYLGVDKAGLWWYNGTTWRPVYPRTLKWLDENTPTWRNLTAGSPLYYSIDGDILTISPAPSSAGTNYFWLYYGKKSVDMSGTDTYPFSGTTTEFTHLSIFDFAIISYAKWKIEPMFNKDMDANLSMQEYIRERSEKNNLFYKRLDIAHSQDIGIKGPPIR